MSLSFTLVLSSLATSTSCSSANASITWGMPKNPIMIGMKGMPPKSSGLPKVMRCQAVSSSVPTMPMARPKIPPTQPLSAMSPPVSAPDIRTPKSPIRKNSAEVNFRASSVKRGVKKARQPIPKSVPMMEAIRNMVMAWAPLPGHCEREAILGGRGVGGCAGDADQNCWKGTARDTADV